MQLRKWHKSSLIPSLLPYNTKVIKTSTQMATRGRIGLQLANGSILSVYSHWDNYPDFNGVKLVEHFNSFQKAAALIDGGDISSLWTNSDWDMNPLPEEGTLYYTDRGDKFSEPRLDANLAEYLLPGIGEEYHYLFANGEWVCYNMNQFSNKLPEVVAISVPAAV